MSRRSLPMAVLFAAGIVCFCPSHAVADAWSVHLDYNVGALASAGGSGTTGSDIASGSIDFQDDPSVTISYNKTFAATDANLALGSLGSTQIQFGLASQVASLHAFATSAAKANWFLPNAPSVSATANAFGSVKWLDIMNIDDPLPDGSPIRVHSRLLVTGNISASCSGDVEPIFHSAQSSVSATLTGMGILDNQTVTPVRASATDNLPHTNTTNVPMPGEVDITWDTFVGDAQAMGEELTLSGFANANVSFGSQLGGQTSAFFDGNYGNTVRWGGITSITDLNTGNPLTDYTVTSSSGFDYTHAAPEPEPSSALVAVALGFIFNSRFTKTGRFE